MKMLIALDWVRRDPTFGRDGRGCGRLVGGVYLRVTVAVWYAHGDGHGVWPRHGGHADDTCTDNSDIDIAAEDDPIRRQLLLAVVAL